MLTRAVRSFRTAPPPYISRGPKCDPRKTVLPPRRSARLRPALRRAQCTWRADTGWAPPELVPSGPIALHPFSHVLHYAIECYEGMKVYRDSSDKLRLFRPKLNMKRFHESCERLCLPAFSQEALLRCIEDLVRLDGDWVPRQKGYSMYMRPVAFSTTPWLGLTQCSEAMIFVLLSPVGPYFKSGFQAIKLAVEEKHIRAWPGGVGAAKCGGNYAPTVLPQIEAARAGCSQALFCYGKDQFVTEAGTMNIFFLWVNEDGEEELITPWLDDGCILPGITRLSVIELCKSWGEFKVTEQAVKLAPLLKASEEGRLLECFGTGTAAVIQPVKSLTYEGKEYTLPIAATGEASGPIAMRVMQQLGDIQNGEVEHEWSHVID